MFCVIYDTYKLSFLFFFFFNDTATTEIYTLSLHDALPISIVPCHCRLKLSGSPYVSTNDALNALGYSSRQLHASLQPQLPQLSFHIRYALYCQSTKSHQQFWSAHTARSDAEGPRMHWASVLRTPPASTRAVATAAVMREVLSPTGPSLQGALLLRWLTRLPALPRGGRGRRGRCRDLRRIRVCHLSHRNRCGGDFLRVQIVEPCECCVKRISPHGPAPSRAVEIEPILRAHHAAQTLAHPSRVTMVVQVRVDRRLTNRTGRMLPDRSEEHTSELQSP